MINNLKNSTSEEKSNGTKKLPSSADLSKRLVDILSNLLGAGNWETSLFLKNAKKRICELREEAQNLVELNINVGPMLTVAQQLAKKLPPGIIKVYISIYQSDSANLQSWLHTVKTLAIYNVTRPTYKNEQQIREMIGSKADIQRHAYAEVLINELDIIPIDPLPVDSLGHELLILKEGSVHLQNIIGFVHANKKRYSVHNTGLVYEGDIEN